MLDSLFHHHVLAGVYVGTNNILGFVDPRTPDVVVMNGAGGLGGGLFLNQSALMQREGDFNVTIAMNIAGDDRGHGVS